jgi:hypothetical protein
MCANVFDIHDVESRIQKTREFYKIEKKEISNTVFINGEFDPWSLLGRNVPENDGVDGETI